MIYGCGAVVGAVKFSAEKAGIFQTPATMAAMVANILLPSILQFCDSFIG